MDEKEHLSSLSYFRLCFRHALLDHEGQDRANRLPKNGLFKDKLTRLKLQNVSYV